MKQERQRRKKSSARDMESEKAKEWVKIPKFLTFSDTFGIACFASILAYSLHPTTLTIYSS